MATIKMATKDDSIEKICSLPLDFKVADKSSFTLLQESKFADFHNDITKQDIVDYLYRHKNLIDKWEIWSEDKRTRGFYLSLNAGNYSVGSLDKDGKENFFKSFATAEEACAEFILREVSAILDIKND
ncbi:MAG: hypothetical protein JWR61_5193 [Ferruginibacter sp.]|uniref:hypothetical protein n=1 Tax=Ferruginibacter sp. TaxID=1940288 RepID=UPI00265A35FF|nr:hypothetical protein [Ferruginibacter sp.]MDB5280238.1 hypothetical protein [Ferruginibacter sp.]